MTAFTLSYRSDTVIMRLRLPVPVDALSLTLPLLERLGVSDATVATVDGWLEFRTPPTLLIEGQSPPARPDTCPKCGSDHQRPPCPCRLPNKADCEDHYRFPCPDPWHTTA
jgi:hypothetical protein